MLLGVTFMLSGCGGAFRANEPLSGQIPETNVYVAEHVVKAALENAGIPNGGGAEIRFSVASAGTAQEIIAAVGPEFLLGRGYTITESRDRFGQIPECIVSIDTLYVNLDRGNGSGGMIDRYAEARIKAELTGIGSAGSARDAMNDDQPAGMRKVYIGSAEYRDSFPRRLIDVTGTGKYYINMFPSRERLKKNVRPLLLGTIMTALVWLLYSYRG
jgi:hypothetical protein